MAASFEHSSVIGIMFKQIHTITTRYLQCAVSDGLRVDVTVIVEEALTRTQLIHVLPMAVAADEENERNANDKEQHGQ